ncbi:hypothetical protein B0H14DRAFT_3870273 [Mycena olivaceomarginata]|nr:hypothetical protein B0H14DRAFT_3870273 [Mycena olivaceomarginata]
MAKSSAKYTLLPDADEGDALLRAPDTPGDDSDEADAEGKNAGSAAGRERGEGSGTFPRWHLKTQALLSDRAHPRLTTLHAATLRAIVPEPIRNNPARAARHLPQGLSLGIHRLDPQPSSFLPLLRSLAPSLLHSPPGLTPSSLSALLSFLPCNRLEPPDIDDDDGLWTYALVWLALERVRTCAFAL